MKKLLLVSGLAVLAAALGPAAISTAAAPAPSPQAENFNLEGKITRLDEGKVTVNTQENIIFHVVYNDKTRFKRADGSAGSAKDLRVGQRIKVSGDLSESGDVIAASIEIEPAEKATTSGLPYPERTESLPKRTFP